MFYSNFLHVLQLKAIQKLKESGGLQKPDPNAVKTVKRKSETVEEFENDTSKGVQLSFLSSTNAN